MFCHSCGTQVSSDVAFCPTCGQSLAAPALSAPPQPFVPRAGIQAAAGRWIGAGWEMVKADIANAILITLVFVVISGVPLIGGAMMAGFHYYFEKKLLGRSADFADLFKGFNFFIPTLVAYLLIAVFTGLGVALCIIPGLVIAAMYKFTYLFIVDKRMDFWPAMQASHAVVKNDYFGFTMFLLLLILVNLLGLLCFAVGLLVSIPVTVAAITIAYQELVGFDSATPDRVG
jgi:uncharacterized membrane protein